MLRFEQGLEVTNALMRFRGARSFDLSPPNAMQWYYDESAQNLLISRNGGAYLPLGGSSDAAAWNVPGDGTTDATAKLLSLIARGDAITLEAGATYLVSRPLTLLAGQILYGNGATLKRAAQLSTTTTTSITSNVTTQITVASAAGFAVGMGIVVQQGIYYDNHDPAVLITAINGNVITVSPAFRLGDGIADFPGPITGTTNVYTAWHLITTSADCRIFDLKINGNRGAWTFARWYSTAEVAFEGDRVELRGLYIYDAPGEAMLSGHCDGVLFDHCSFLNINGNGIHMGGDTPVVISACWFKNCNLDLTVGHQDGCLSWSNTIQDVLVVGCHMENGKSGIGSIDYDGNSDLAVIGCDIRNCTTSAIEADCSTDLGTSRALFLGNRIYDSVKVSISSGRSVVSEFPNRFIFVGNTFKNTLFDARKATHLLIQGNDFASPADITNTLVYLENCQDCTLVGNTVLGGNRGIGVDGSTSQDIAITRNRLTGQRNRGIEIMGAADGRDGMDIEHNTVRNGAAAISTYDGIIGRSKTRIHGNRVILDGLGHAGIYPQNGSIVDDNHVRQGSATFSIRADGATSAILCQNNYYNGSAPSNGGGGSNTFVNNLAAL